MTLGAADNTATVLDQMQNPQNTKRLWGFPTSIIFVLLTQEHGGDVTPEL